MVGTSSSGNPNIAEISKLSSTGPKSEIGKLKVSLSRCTTCAQTYTLDKTMEELGIKFQKTTEASALKKMFVSWIKSRTMKELTEIEKLDEVIILLESDVSNRTMNKLEKGLPFGDNDIKAMKLLKETLEASHKLKFGEKHLNINADYKDLREMMFNE